jgi:hypothetical protein
MPLQKFLDGIFTGSWLCWLIEPVNQQSSGEGIDPRETPNGCEYN